MNAKTINISSLVILLSFFSIIMQSLLYYFLPSPVWAMLAATISLIVLCHFFLESSFSYAYVTLFAATMTLGMFMFAAVTYLIQPNQWLKYHFSLVYIVLLNWIVPMIYGIIRDINDGGPRFEGFDFYFKDMAIIIGSVYFICILKQFFLEPIEPPFAKPEFGANSFVPFMATSSHIEELLSKDKSILQVILYLLELVCLYIPFGFYIRFFCRRLMFPVRLVIYAGFPLLIEILQAVTGRGRAHIDDYMTSIVGIIIGICLCLFLNVIYQSLSGRSIGTVRNNVDLTKFNSKNEFDI